MMRAKDSADRERRTPQEWRDVFVLELRMRDVRGDAIGDALAEVESHCVETGESPQEAFGEPLDYAASVAQVQRDAGRLVPVSRAWSGVGIGLVAMVGAGATINGAIALITGNGDVALTLGAVLGALALAAVVAGWIGLGRSLGRRFSAKAQFGLLAVLLVAGPALVAVLVGLFDRRLATLPAWLILVVGLLSLAAGWFFIDRTTFGPNEDRVIDPVTGEDPLPELPRWVRVAMPVALAALLAVAILLAAVLAG